MIGGLRTPQLVVAGAVVAAGLAGATAAIGGRNADPQFLRDQRFPPPLRGTDVARVVKSAPDPATGKGSGSAATCKPGSGRPLGNPWSCVVRYPSDKQVAIRVRVLEDGTYTGRYAGGGGATGCCIDLPGTR
jgi:hypothetical protein